MTRRLLTVITMLVVLASARPARANFGGFFDWLGELSGPGKFGGYGIDAPVACYGVKQLKASAANTPPVSATGTSAQGVGGGATATLASASWHAFPCFDLARTRPRVYTSVVFGKMWTHTNPYTYAPEKQALSDAVNAMPLMAVVDASIPALADKGKWGGRLLFGVGGGAIRFSGDRFDAFWKPTWEAPRVTYEVPISDRFVFFTQFAIKFISPVNPGEFGAIAGNDSGTYHKAFVTAGFRY